MRKKVLVVQHVENEGLGIIKDGLKRSGLVPEHVRVYKGERIPASVAGYSALIILGGPMGVYEEDKYPFIKDELGLIESAYKEDFPVLGVCLGSQMMAKAAGAPVYRGKTKEIGFYRITVTDDGERDGLLLGLPPEMTVFQWHGDTFDVPERARNLASSKMFPNQLIRVGRRAYGFQFHFEVTEEMVRGFIDAGRDELAELKGKIDPKKILMETPEKIPEIIGWGSTIIKRFLRLVV